VSRKVELFRIGGLMEIVGFPQSGAAGVAYSTTFTGTGGDGSYTFDISVDPATGWSAIGGVLSNAAPAADDYTATVTMADGSRSPPVTQTYRFSIT
jgi:hypothetical protein